ncbi:MAG: diguanylate cyclase [Chloroflexota bacterium]|nr:diguanylate cyclase [Chloroflexota bacterium]
MNYPSTFEMPTTDPMTGLLNATYFRHLLREQLMPQAQASGEPLSLALFDLDSFMAANTTYGRKAGDAMLRGVVDAVRATLPETAVVVRNGGDEFGVVLPETRLDDAFTLMEELRRHIAALTFPDWPDLHFTCSVGLAGFPAHGASDVELVREADQALYLAKTTGRNKVALPITDSRMITKTSYYTATQLERLSQLAKTVKRNEATLLREALDDLIKKYTERLAAPPQI